MNILKNFVPHETITGDDKDTPRNKKIKALLKKVKIRYVKISCEKKT